MKNILISGKLVPGHQVASGKCNDPRFPTGTIAMQKPYFETLGVAMQSFYLGTLNIDISPLIFSILKPDHQINHLLWSDALPAENFSFVKCQIHYKNTCFSSLLYYPDPATKADHFQSKHMMEILSEHIPTIEYGDNVVLEFAANTIKFKPLLD